ncbi:S1 family peptidase [Sphingomonas oryzagri]
MAIDQTTVILTRPQMEMAVGQKISIEQLLLRPWQEGGLKTVEELSTFHGALLVLGGFGGGWSYTYGSAVPVAPGIAVAAGHVIHQHQRDGFFDDETSAMYAFGVTPQGATAWLVIALSYSDEGDIAVLTLAYACQMPREMRIAHYAVSARLPVAGEMVTAVGFRPREGQRIIEPGEQLPDLHGTFLLSSGPVLDVWGSGRDKVVAPRPCFAAALATVGAMSGGAVLNADGHMIGIVTSSLENPTEPYTIATMIWDALVTEIEPIWPPDYWKGRAALRDLIDPEDGWRLQWSHQEESWRYQVDGYRP